MKRFQLFLLIIAVILLIPLVAMQFTTQVKWSFFDFLVAGFLLCSTAIICEMVLRKFQSKKLRIIICSLILLILLLIWAELAVGVFDKLIFLE